MMQKQVLYLCGLLLLGLHVKAQEAEGKLWLNYALKVPVSEKLTYGGDAGYRDLITEGGWKQFLIRPAATYRISPVFTLGGAVAYFKTFGESISKLDEFRIHQEVNLGWPDFGFARLSFRLRVEERFFVYKNLPDDFNVRIRLMGQVRTRDLTFLGSRRPIYFKVIFEGFETPNQEGASELFINHTRTHFAFGHRLSRAWRYEVHYIRQQSRLLTTGGFLLSQNILRLRVFHTVFDKKREIPEIVDPEIE